MAKLSTDELLDAFKDMTLLELSDFVKKFEETFEVTAAAPVAAVAAAPAPAVAAEARSVVASPASARIVGNNVNRAVASTAVALPKA